MNVIINLQNVSPASLQGVYSLSDIDLSRFNKELSTQDLKMLTYFLR